MSDKSKISSYYHSFNKQQKETILHKSNLPISYKQPSPPASTQTLPVNYMCAAEYEIIDLRDNKILFIQRCTFTTSMMNDLLLHWTLLHRRSDINHHLPPEPNATSFNVTSFNPSRCIENIGVIPADKLAKFNKCFKWMLWDMASTLLTHAMYKSNEVAIMNQTESSSLNDNYSRAVSSDKAVSFGLYYKLSQTKRTKFNKKDAKIVLLQHQTLQ